MAKPTFKARVKTRKRSNFPKPARKPATKPKEKKQMTRRHDNEEEAPAPAYESGDLKKDHQAAKEDVNRAAVHVADSLKLAFDRMGANADKKHVASMRKITKDLQSVLDDVNALGAKEQKAEQED